MIHASKFNFEKNFMKYIIGNRKFKNFSLMNVNLLYQINLLSYIKAFYIYLISR